MPCGWNLSQRGRSSRESFRRHYFTTVSIYLLSYVLTLLPPTLSRLWMALGWPPVFVITLLHALSAPGVGIRDFGAFFVNHYRKLRRDRESAEFHDAMLKGVQRSQPSPTLQSPLKGYRSGRSRIEVVGTAVPPPSRPPHQAPLGRWSSHAIDPVMP